MKDIKHSQMFWQKRKKKEEKEGLEKLYNAHKCIGCKKKLYVSSVSPCIEISQLEA